MNKPKEIPVDIRNKIAKETGSTDQAEKLISLCNSVYKKNINVGYEQLIRAMLIVSNFDFTAFENIIHGNFYGDPRDVLMHAHFTNAEINYGINEFL